jgi:hypothetical protein
MCVRTAFGEFTCEGFENMKSQLVCPFPLYGDPVVVPPGKEFPAAHLGFINDGRGHGKPPCEQLVGVPAELVDVDRDVFAEQHIAVIVLDEAWYATTQGGHRCAPARLGAVFVDVGPQGSGQLRTTLAAAKGEQSNQTLAA